MDRLPLEFSERLFGITAVRITAVIADEKAFLAQLAHPGMVTGTYEIQEISAVEKSIERYAYARARKL